MRQRSITTLVCGWLAASALLVGLTGCGGAEAERPTAPKAEHPKIAAMLPDEIRDRGSLKVAMSADYPPDHFMEKGRLTGFDPDISRALEKVLGVRFELVGTNFEGIIPGLQARRYDIAVSTVFITDERAKVVDFVRYFDSGSSIVVHADRPLGIKSLDDTCGHRAAVEKGTAAVDDMNAQSKRCVAAGKKRIDVQTYAKQTEANLALLSGQADLLAFNSSAAGYAAKRSPKFRVITEYAKFPTGIILPKGQQQLAKALRAAVQALIDDGSYLKILDKWGMEAGAVKKPEIVSRPESG